MRAEHAPLSLQAFAAAFEEKVADHNVDWEIVGFVAPSTRVYTLGTDTKVLSTAFESIVAPLVGEIANESGYVVDTSLQTIYPDFTLTPKETDRDRIAIDVKTTYRKPGAIVYTLGSYTSFLRSPEATKNIRFPYAEYSEHWVIGFLYSRRPEAQVSIYESLDDVPAEACPYFDVEYFVQDKFRVAGLSPGSGNTTNIGSIKARTIDEFRAGRGPFTEHGKDVCDEFWRSYPRGKKPGPEFASVDAFLASRRSRRI